MPITVRHDPSATLYGEAAFDIGANKRRDELRRIAAQQQAQMQENALRARQIQMQQQAQARAFGLEKQKYLDEKAMKERMLVDAKAEKEAQRTFLAKQKAAEIASQREKEKASYAESEYKKESDMVTKMALDVQKALEENEYDDLQVKEISKIDNQMEIVRGSKELDEQQRAREILKLQYKKYSIRPNKRKESEDQTEMRKNGWGFTPDGKSFFKNTGKTVMQKVIGPDGEVYEYPTTYGPDGQPRMETVIQQLEIATKAKAQAAALAAKHESELSKMSPVQAAKLRSIEQENALLDDKYKARYDALSRKAISATKVFEAAAYNGDKEGMDKAQAALQKINEDFEKLQEDRIKALDDLQKKKDDALQKIEESRSKNEKSKEKGGIASTITEGGRKINPAVKKAMEFMRGPRSLYR